MSITNPRENEVYVAGTNSILPKEHGNQFVSLPIVKFCEKYVKGVSAVESILALDRLRQEVAIKELITANGNPQIQEALIRKTASVPNIGIMITSALGGGSSTKLNDTANKSDSSFDLSYL